jgi:dihydrolipoyl dehydrogenase
VAAIRAAQLGLSTAIIENKYWGGVCLNVGCIPSKALLRNAELAHIFHADAQTFGISGEVSFDFEVAYARSRAVADRMVKGVHYLMRKNKITEYEGWGEFTDPNTIVVQGENDTTTLTFDHAIISTGARTLLLPGTSLSDRVVTYEEQILTKELPESILIAGAGAIGVEFGYVLANYGAQVTIVEFLDRMVPLEDSEVSAELARAYKKLGVTVLTGTKVEAIDDSGDKVKVTVGPAAGGDGKVLEADKVLQAIGFAPRTDGYGLDKTGVELTERGAIAIDGFMRTSVSHIYAIGDVTAKLMLAHNAEAMGIVAAEAIAGSETMEIDYDMVPRRPTANRRLARSATPSSRRVTKGMR